MPAGLLSFLDVLLRGSILSGQALALGGLAFILLILGPLARRETDPRALLSPTLDLAALGAAGVAVAQVVSLLLEVGSLADDAGWPLAAAFSTPFFRASLGRVGACVGFLLGSRLVRRSPGAATGWAALTGSGLLLVGSSAWMSHAAARLESRGILLGLDALHQIGATVWVGGLVHLFAAARRVEAPWPRATLRRFSAVAVVAVLILLAAGLGLSLYYVDSLRALVGTAYGWMLLAKVSLLAGLLVFGGTNFLAVRRLSSATTAPPPQLRKFVEAEVGLGLTAFFVAASLTSLPPAVDVVADRATPAEVLARFTPQWPTLSSPSLSELPIADPLAPRTAEDIAWSEYNHHWAGLFVLAMGVLAVLERGGRIRSARHWPLLFLGLAGFLFVRDDPGAWPLGPMGFWESMTVSSVLQHRFFVLLTVIFGIFEWRVRTGRLRSPRWALVFPALSAVGGAFLLTHSHALLNLKAEFLIEVTHIPLGLLGVFVGWTRWLELRLPPPDNRALGWCWTLGLVLVGLLLVLYRER
jgi:putative copper resistance protein D